jgi:hypothetical protein
MPDLNDYEETMLRWSNLVCTAGLAFSFYLPYCLGQPRAPAATLILEYRDVGVCYV